MQVSAEIRWFWHNQPPLEFKDWFFHGPHDFSPGGGQRIRADHYLHDTSQAEMGLKRRGGKRGVEIKGLVIVVSPGLDIGPFSGDMEIWTKWTTESLELPSQSLVAVEELR